VIGRLLLFAALAVAVAIVAAGACAPQSATPSPTPAVTAAAPSPSPTQAARPSPTPTASPSPTPTAAASPTGTPGTPPPQACPTLTGGDSGANVQVTGLRAAHQPGFDRIVLEFGPSGLPGRYAVPAYTLAVATQFTATSGRQVPVDGNAFYSLRFGFGTASTVDPQTGRQTFTQTDLRPGLPLVREVKLIDDFERTMTWGIGLERLSCARVSVLADPARLVVDLPTPP
jgi:hypothetical protein